MTCPHTSPPGPHVVSTPGECSTCRQPVSDDTIARRPMLPGTAWYVGTRDDDNRFPSWDELGKKSRRDYIDAAIRDRALASHTKEGKE